MGSPITRNTTGRRITQGTLIAERHSLVAQLRAGQEEERRRISHELHDQFGQLLTGFSLNLKAAEEAESLDTCQSALCQLRALADEMGLELHRLAAGLRPSALEYLDLVPALETYVRLWGVQSGIFATFAVHDRNNMARLSSLAETTIYRVVQEALTNVARHAIPGGATAASVTMQQCNETLQVIVEDNGPGFDGAAALRSGRLGLTGMQERAELVGGVLEIETCAEGTTLFLRIPTS